MYQDVLLNCRKSFSKMDGLYEKRCVYQSLAEKVTASFSLAPVHTNDDNDRSKFKIKVIEIEQQLSKELAKAKDLQRQSFRIIALLPNARMRKIFKLRYILCYNWGVVADYMRKEKGDMRAGTLRTVLRIHADGIAYLEKLENTKCSA